MDEIIIIYSCVNSPKTNEHDEGLMVFTEVPKKDQIYIKTQLNQTVRAFIGDDLMNTMDWSNNITINDKASPEGDLCKGEVVELPVILWFLIFLCLVGFLLFGDFGRFKCKMTSNRVEVLG